MKTIATIYFGFLFVCCSFAHEMRTWTATNGSKMEAAFVKYEEPNVHMQKRDGTILRVNRDNLSDEDWVYVMKHDPSIFSLWIKLGEPVSSELSALRNGQLPRLIDEPNPRRSVFISSDGRMCIQSSFHQQQRVSAVFPLDEYCFDKTTFKESKLDGGWGNETGLLKKLYLNKNNGTVSTDETSGDWLFDIQCISAGNFAGVTFVLNTKQPTVSVDQQVQYYPGDRQNQGANIVKVSPLMMTADEWFSFGQVFEKRETVFGKIPRYRRIDAILKAKSTGVPKDTISRNAGAMVSSGSGFFVTKDGFFLTNCHVVEGHRKIQLMTKDGIKKATIVRMDPGVDLALLKTEPGNYESIPFAKGMKVSLGEDIFTIGFPMPDIQGFSPKMTKGVISSLNGIQDEDLNYQIDASIQPGNSGGPLVNNNGELVGVIVSSLRDSYIAEKKGVIPQNVNYAIKAKHVIDFLGQVPGCRKQITFSNQPKIQTSAEPVTIETVQSACAMVMVFE